MLPIGSPIAEDARHPTIAVDRAVPPLAARRTAVDQDRVALLVILAFAASLRLFHLTAPFTDWHAWRQLDTVAMARAFYEGSFWPFDPEVNWGGPNGYVEAECPLIPALIAVIYRIVGPHEIAGRLVIIAFSIGLVWATYRLALILDGRRSVARAAAFLIAVSPAAIFFGRIVIPDTPMVFFTVLALVGFAEFSRTGSVRWMVTGASALTIACLLKLPAVFVGPAIVALLVRERGWSAFRDPQVWLAGVIPLAITAAWYWRAHVVFERTGLTMGILGTPAKIYPASVSPGPWTNVFSKWSTWALLSDSGFYARMYSRFYHLLLLPIGFVGAVLGALLWKAPGRRAMTVWLTSLTVFFFITANVQRGHEYYQLPFVVVAAIFFGGAAWPLFDDAWLKRHLGGGRLLLPSYMVIIALLGISSIYSSGAIRIFFEPQLGTERMRQAGRVIDVLSDDSQLAIVVDDYGIMSPILLYFAHLKGWSFDPTDVSPAVIDNLRGLGARYFVTTRWRELKSERPEAAAVLEMYQDVLITGVPADTRLVDLRLRK
jgi:4-amino-4-deoxy-L-arabinose transferase-like glycosyltransferase